MARNTKETSFVNRDLKGIQSSMSSGLTTSSESALARQKLRSLANLHQDHSLIPYLGQIHENETFASLLSRRES